MENLFPLIALCFIFIFSAGEASDFESLYRDGKFDEAQSLLLETLKSNPTHGRAHAHLSLCFIQKNEWNLAYAHALTAWLLDPQNSCLRWNLELTQQKSHLPLNGIEPLYRSYRNLAGWCSVFVWQMIGWGGALLLFWGVSRSLSRLYQTGRPIRRLDQAGVALGLILLGVACFALYQYELLGNPRVMVLVQEAELKSIPTDLSEGVQSRKIPAGTIALMKKEFLGWVKIKLPQNEEGWIRKSTGLPLYSTYQE